MKWTRIVILIGFAATIMAGDSSSRSRTFQDRWVYVSTDLNSDRELERIEGIARTASEHGLDGVLLSAGFDAMDLKSQESLTRLARLKQTCDRLGVEIIPAGFGVGYGGGVLAHNKNLAAGQPVLGALFVAKGQEATFQADPAMKIANASFEETDHPSVPSSTRRGDLPAGFTAHGSRAMIDTTVSHSGKASVRFEEFSNPENGVYLAQSIRVHPYRSYRLRAWVKTEGAGPRMAIHLLAVAPDGRELSYMEPPLPETSDWHQVVWGFNTWYADKVEFRVGVSDGKNGKVWVDDVAIEEVGLTNVLRRPGTPLKVSNEKTGVVYEEGRDFAPVSDPQLDFSWNHEGPAIKLLPGSRIHTGDRLRVDYYHGTTIYRDQTAIDMSEPAVYEVWQHQIPLIEKYLAPKKYFLSMDEVRVGGFCEACKRRHLSMSEILGDCVTRQYKMIRAANPKAEVYVWSDMFDPNHNAREKYYLIDGSFDGTWKYIPKDLVIGCWYYEKRDQSLEFFAKLGYQTLAAAYYDADDLENPKGWIESLDHTQGAIGIMYTTWENKYQLLPAFGDLVSKR
ncbi:MAG: hypothetical protein ABSH52_17070 [Terriglobia bacterium]|jgi:hypothetical protein